ASSTGPSRWGSPDTHGVHAMKRLLIILLLLALALFVGLKLLEGAAERLVETQASRALGTEVTVGRLQLHPLAAAVTLHELQLAEPALTAEALRADFNPEALFQQKVVVNHARLRGARLALPTA